jgi:multiple sugar transport system permease protein
VDAFSTPVKWVAPFTLENYTRLWIDQAFYVNFLNTAIVTAGTVTVSLTVGCLAGYALARYRGSLGFWLLLVALVFRALPHSTLLPSFFTMFNALGINNHLVTLIFVLWRSTSLSPSGCCAPSSSTSRRSSMRRPWWTGAPVHRPSAASSCP